jgi:hypothetical protein
VKSHPYLFAVIVLSSFLALLLLPPAFAQEKVEPEAALDGAEDDNLSLNATDTDGEEVPILEQVSDKGIYRVQLRWAQLPLNPEDAFELEVVFLNASSPRANSTSFPQAESNVSGSGSEAGATVPDIIETPLPVESYDITMYADDGTELWKQVNQPGQGGRSGQRIQLESNYTGPVTIEITNIRPGWETTATTAASGEDMTDSVTFTATVVPEFSVIAVLPFAVGIATVLALRLKRM